MIVDTRKKIFVIIGESCSGKDTLVKHMESINQSYRSVVSYTNRPKRENETEGIEHYFLSKDEFDDKRRKEHKNIAAYVKLSSNNEIEGYEYMAMKDELKKSMFYILDPKGLEDLRSNLKNELDIITIYVYCPYNQREERAKVRGGSFAKFLERNRAERTMFDHFYRHKKFDYVIYNMDGMEEVSKKIIERIVDYEIKERDVDSEFTSVFGNSYKKSDISNAISYLKNVTDLYKVHYIKNSQFVREAEVNCNLIQDILLSHMR